MSKSKIKDIINWWNQFDNTDIKISTTKHELDITITKNTLPHLLGLHYLSKNPNKITAKNLYSIIKDKSDSQIYEMVKNNSPSKLSSVKNRIKYFEYFMKNLEKAELYENVHPETKIKSNYFMVEMDDGKYLHLGIVDQGYMDYLETFIVEDRNKYINNSSIKEKIVSIERYENDNLIPFSFDEVKNHKLLAEYYEKKKLEKEKPSLISKIDKLSKKVAKENKQVIINKQITKKGIER